MFLLGTRYTQFVTGHTQRPLNSSRPKNMKWPTFARNWAMWVPCVAIGWWLSWVNLSKISAFDEIGGWLNLFKHTFSCTQVFRCGILVNWINCCVLERCISFLKANDGYPSLPYQRQLWCVFSFMGWWKTSCSRGHRTYMFIMYHPIVQWFTNGFEVEKVRNSDRIGFGHETCSHTVDGSEIPNNHLGCTETRQ